jgi:hypothetical protein
MVLSVQRMIQQLEYMPDKILPRSMPKIPASHVSPEKEKSWQGFTLPKGK